MQLFVFKRSISSCHKLLRQLTQPLTVADHAANSKNWSSAKEYTSIPGPSKLGLIAAHLPGGKLYNSNLVDLHRVFRQQYGDIFRLKGMLGKKDMVFTYNAKDFETVYRNEGMWPIRTGLESFSYYRKVKRADFFDGIGGLTSENGKSWADIRNKVNPILMKIQNVRLNLPQIDEIASEFMLKLEELIDPSTNLLKTNFHDELKIWSFESICYIALNSRIGLLTNKPDANMQKLAEYMSEFFQAIFEYDVKPSVWHYFETPGFKRLLHVYDEITNITSNYIDTAIEKFEAEGNTEPQSVLEKLCQIDRKVAIVMSMDLLMAGIDTTTSAFITVLYHLARNPAKQATLRKELNSLIPTANTSLTKCDTNAMVYLRSCIKEGLRLTPITPGNFRITIKDLVLSGYKIPSGTGIIMGVMDLSKSEQYFKHCNEFLPERWLKSGPNACPEAKSTNPFVYLPFGFGARSCIGKRIAEMELETLLAKLLRKYEVSWAQAEDLKYTSNIILTPSGKMHFKFVPLY